MLVWMCVNAAKKKLILACAPPRLNKQESIELVTGALKVGLVNQLHAGGLPELR